MNNPTTLQDVIDSKPDFFDYLYNRPVGTHSRITGGLSPVPPVWSNWREEQRAWRESAVLFDQAHHMPELILSGPDARKLLTRVGVNSLENFAPGVAKQFVACNSRGQIIGECVMHDLGKKAGYELISGKPILDWVEYHAQTGGYDVSIEHDPATWDNTKGRRNFRFGMDGPHAWTIFQAVVQGEAPEIKFFHTARVRIAGVDVLALRHGMAGHRGVELSGPFEHGAKVRAAILAAGAEYGLRPGGSAAYFSAVAESGWISYPLPAVYTGDDEAGFRQWLPADSWEARFQVGGSYIPESLDDYYVTPYDLGLGRIVKFDHDFIGREALEAIADAPPRTKVALEWNPEDVARIMQSQYGDGPRYKWIDFPNSDYSQIQRDEVRTPGGELVGLSTHSCYTANERASVSLGILDRAYAEPGTEVVITWGEPNGGSAKSTVERHEQTTIRATVAPVPFSRTVRELKRQTTSSS